MFITAFVFLLLIGLLSALQPGDRISMLTQSLHSDSKTDWIDMPVHMMPRFGEPDSHIFHTVIPKFSENSTDYRINPRSDLKISFTFLGNKLSIPWIAVYSAKDRISLKRLVIKFTRDEFEVVQVDVEKICKFFMFQTIYYIVILYCLLAILLIVTYIEFTFRWF